MKSLGALFREFTYLPFEVIYDNAFPYGLS